MLKIAIIVGSTRPNRRAPDVAKWVLDLRRQARRRDLRDRRHRRLRPAGARRADAAVDAANTPTDHTKRWGETIAAYDGFVFVTPEYNHSISGALKNAIDFVYHEWTNKAAGFVSYGTTGGVRAVEHLRGIMAEVQVADVRAHVSMSLLHRLRELHGVQAGGRARAAARRHARPARRLEPGDEGRARREGSRRRLTGRPSRRQDARVRCADVAAYSSGGDLAAGLDVLHRVDGVAVDPDLVVEVRAGRAAGACRCGRGRCPWTTTWPTVTSISLRWP